MKIIVNTPYINIPAGVANHYLGLKPYFSKNVIYNQYLPSSNIHNKYLLKIKSLIIPFLKLYDLIKFIILVVIHGRPIILLNPSFGKTALMRDALFLRISKLLGCRVAVFLHGWDRLYFEKVLNKEEPFSRFWFKADAFFVLAKEFQTYLSQLGISAPVHLTTTKVDDRLLTDFQIKNKSGINTILFLARVERAKGIFTAIDAFELINKKHQNLKLNIAGSGNALDEVIDYVQKKQLKNIALKGSVSGIKLQKEFTSADIYILPTHGEGMPTSVLEAMAFGLPIISRPVGGLVDFFENGKMGYLIESLDPKCYAEKIELLINDLNFTNKIATYNMQYANEHFMASKVAPSLEKILTNLS